MDTSTLVVDATNDRVGMGTATPGSRLDVRFATNPAINNAVPTNALRVFTSVAQAVDVGGQIGLGGLYNATDFQAFGNISGKKENSTSGNNAGYLVVGTCDSGGTMAERYRIGSTGISTWSVAGTTAMTLDSTGLGVGGIVTGTGPTILVEGTAGTYAKFNSKVGAKTWSAGYRSGTTQFEIQEDGTERFVIANGGNVGIGVTPSAWANTTTIWKALDLQYSCGIASSGAGSGEIDFLWNAYYDQTDQRWEFKYTGDRASRYAIGGAGVHTWYNTASAGTANAAITWVPAMTLDASGNLLVGTTSVLNSARLSLKAASVVTVLSLNGVTGDTAQESFVINKFDSNSTTSQVFARFTNGNGANGSGQINGNGANACAFGTFSDSRLKENILSLPSQLANILSLRPVEFDYKDGSGHQIGFVAQEMQEVYSDAVGEQNGFLTVTGWSKTEARLVSAIKELAAKVQALEAKLA